MIRAFCMGCLELVATILFVGTLFLWMVILVG